MELLTHSILTNEIKCQSYIQTTLEDDMNVPDTKPDIDKLIKIHGDIQLQDITPGEDKVTVRGNLNFSLLYFSKDDIRPIHNITGKIPFDETINMDGVSQGADVFCHFELEDCQSSLINSRKVSIRAILSLHCCQNEQNSVIIGTDIVSEDAVRAGMEMADLPEGLHKKYNSLTFTQPVLQKNDIFRINDEITLPKGKSSMDTILYHEIICQNVQTRLVEDGIRIMGDSSVFILYTPEDDDRRLEYFETEVPFDGIVNCNGCNDDMIHDIEIIPDTKELSIKSDEDGENRILDMELVLKLQMKFYEDEEIKILDDAYSTSCSLKLTKEPVSYEKLLMKNQSSVRVSDRIKADNNDNILQICRSSGMVQIDEQEITDDGIRIEGVISLDILYITDNDEQPINVVKGVIPFQHTIEIKGIAPDNSYELQPEISQITTLMADNSEIEAKVSLSICAIVFSRQSIHAITAIAEEPLDFKKLQEMPGLVGFIADSDDTLWSIAKKYFTTPESIMELNNLTSDEVKKGDRLILMKTVDAL